MSRKWKKRLLTGCLALLTAVLIAGDVLLIRMSRKEKILQFRPDRTNPIVLHGAPRETENRWWRLFPPNSKAPELSVQAVEGDAMFRLGDHRGARPVVLIFGSFT